MLTNYNFFGFKIALKSDEKELIDIIDKNFSLFKSDNNSAPSLTIKTFIVDDLCNKIPSGLTAIKQSINSISYQVKNKRYNDYYGEAITELDYEKNTAHIWATDINRLHEITYLLIMSRQGKWCDKNGVHKIHAMGIKGKSKNLLLMLPMKGGKSTMFAQFLSQTDFDLISDDSPVVNRDGTIANFNIRFGLEKKAMYNPLLAKINQEHIFSLQREQFGEKTLVDFKAFEHRISSPHKKSILIQGVRTNDKNIEIKKINQLKMFKHVFVNMTIGVGLPMIIEYFIENSLKDHMGNIVIFCKRLFASLNLIRESECYFAYMGNDIQKNFKALEELARE
jgi:hypothetical protein